MYIYFLRLTQVVHIVTRPVGKGRSLSNKWLQLINMNICVVTALLVLQNLEVGTRTTSLKLKPANR